MSSKKCHQQVSQHTGNQKWLTHSLSQWVSQWQGHLMSCSGQLKINLVNTTIKIMFFVALSFLETVCVIHMTGWQWCLQSLWIDRRDERIDSRDERPQKRDAAENIQPINKVWRWGAMNKKYQQAPTSNNKLKQKIFRQWTINIIGKLWKCEEDEQN